MRPNILHNKLHPTDYDRIAFIEDHYEDLKEMYINIMEHLKIPAGSSSGGGSIDLFTSTYTTNNYYIFNMPQESNLLKYETEENILQLQSLVRLHLYARVGYNVNAEYFLAPLVEGNKLMFPKPSGDPDSGELYLPFNKTNLIGLYNDWISASDLQTYNVFNINEISGSYYDIQPVSKIDLEEKTFISNYLPTLYQVCNYGN